MRTSIGCSALAVSLGLVFLAGCGGAENAGAASAEALTAFCDDACYGDVSSLSDATALATFTSRNADKDELGLLAKLDEAATKLCTAKPADAVQKLQDYLTQVQKLVCQAKIAPTVDDQGNVVVTPEMLVAGATAAILCIDPAYVFPEFVCP